MAEGNTALQILVIAGDRALRSQLVLFLQDQGMDVLTASDAGGGLREAGQHHPALVLLEATVGRVDGVDVFRQLRSAPLTAHIPIMFIADFRDARRQHDLLAVGADDVLTMPLDLDILWLRVRNAIKRSQRQGLTEPRTGLPTGPLIAEQVAARQGQREACHLQVSIANFDAFRARYDFIAGNEVLRYAASMIHEIVEEAGAPGDFVGHHGEADFVILTRQKHAPAIREALRTRLADGLLQFYSFMERDQGFVQVDDGQGGQVSRPLMHLLIEEPAVR